MLTASGLAYPSIVCPHILVVNRLNTIKRHQSDTLPIRQEGNSNGVVAFHLFGFDRQIG